MPPDLHVFPALVLQGYETGNSSEVIQTVSAEFGRLGVFARGIRSLRSPLRPLMQPLALVELSVAWRPGADLANLRDANLLQSPSNLVMDLERFAAAQLLAEAAASACEVAQPSPEVFAALTDGLADLVPDATHPAPTALLHGLLGILAAAGYCPHIDPGLLRPWPADRPRPVCFWLDVEEGRLHADRPQPAVAPPWPQSVPAGVRHIPLPPMAVRAVHAATTGARRIAPPSPQALQLAGALITLFEHHHQHPLRSAAFWREIARG